MTCYIYIYIYIDKGFFSKVCKSIYTEGERQKKILVLLWFHLLINFPWVEQRLLLDDFYSLSLFFIVGLVLK